MSARKQARLVATKRSKYGNRKVQIDGHTFDSQAEARRYCQLRDMQSAGLIDDLKLQVPFVLAPGVRVKGRMRPPLRYLADFVFRQDGNTVVEDVKGRVTEGYRIKRHLLKAVHGIDIVEVR